ncbi:hypothetical protein EG329_012240 [Mollisiaceae sp. DMI_Dod_QoI]|nr:hypothetical protein EG329_012240 [Helotiales sp. DMI_Dod_QoI]
MAPKRTASHAEIWDDSALVDSWNDALEEYKARSEHSRRRRRRDPEEDRKVEQSKVSLLLWDPAQGSRRFRGEEMHYEEGEVDELLVHESHAKELLSEETNRHNTGSVEEHVQVRERLSVPEQAAARSPALPQHLIGQVHDEGLKNLLMSWYYAGYYTGLFEGRQEAKTSTSAKHEA